MKESEEMRRAMEPLELMKRVRQQPFSFNQLVISIFDITSLDYDKGIWFAFVLMGSSFFSVEYTCMVGSGKGFFFQDGIIEMW